MIRIPRNLLPLVAVAVATASIASAQATDLKGVDEKKDGLAAPKSDSGANIEIVTTETVPGKVCKSVGAPFPAVARQRKWSWEQSTQTLRAAAVRAGANAVVGVRMSPYVPSTNRLRLHIYGTLARCE